MLCLFLGVLGELLVPVLCLIVICAFCSKFVLMNKLATRGLNKSCKNVLFLTAHPDDECMFFTPSILALLREGHRVFVVCFSKGNFYSLGEVRKKELLASCSKLGVSASQVSIIDDSRFPDDPSADWSIDDLGEKITSVVQRINADCVITFDNNGVSGHRNHIALYHALRKLCDGKKLGEHILLFSLASTSICRKYISWFDIPLSVIFCRTVFVCFPFEWLKGCRAMVAHQSQLVWFRRLYIMFSRYMVVNTLQEITSSSAR